MSEAAIIEREIVTTGLDEITPRRLSHLYPTRGSGPPELGDVAICGWIKRSPQWEFHAYPGQFQRCKVCFPNG